MKNYMKFIWIGIFCGLLCILGYAVRIDRFNSSDIVLLFGMNEVSYFIQYLPELVYWFMPMIFFQIFFGTYIYRHFCVASIYYFSRNPHRTKWFLKEAFYLYLFGVVYLITMIFFGIICCTLISRVTFDFDTIKVLLVYIMLYSLYLFVTTLGINIVAIICNSNAGFLIVEGINIFSIAGFTILGDYFAPQGVILEEYEWVLKINPIYYIIMGLDKSQTDYAISLLLYSILAVLVLGIGCIVVNRHQFIELNKEVGGI